MASNRLVLRSTPSPYNFPLSDIVKGSVLSWNEVDNNFIFLKGLNIQSGVVNGTDLVLNRINGTNISIDLSAFTGGTGTDTFVTGGTYNSSASTITFTNNTGGTFTVTGVTSGGGSQYVNNIIPSGLTITVPQNQQYLVYGDLTLAGQLDNFGNVVIIDGSLINSGGTFNNSGTTTFVSFTGGTGTDVFVTGGTYNSSASTITFTNNTGGTFTVTGISGGTGTDYYTTGFTFNPANYDLTVSLNNGNNLTQNLGILAGDLKVTGGTYNPANGVATFTNNSGGTFQVTGFLTGYTDTYTISAGLNGNTIEFDRTDTPNAYSVDLSPILSGFSGTDVFVTGGTYSSSASTITFTNNTGGTFTVTGISGGTSGGTASPAGSDTFIQFNDAGSFGANSGLTYDNTLNNFFTESRIGTKTTTLTNGITSLFGQPLSGASGIVYNNSLSGASAFTGVFVGDFTDVGGDDYSTLIGYVDNSTFEFSFANFTTEGIQLLNRDPLAYEADLTISPQNNVVSLTYDDNILNTSSYLSLNPDGINLYHVTGGTSTGFFINNNYGINANLVNIGQTQSFTVTREIAPSVYQNYLSVNTNGDVRINDVYTFPNVDGSPNQVLQTDGSGNVSWATVSGGSGSTSPAGSDTFIQFNDSGSFGANSGLTYDYTDNTFKTETTIGTSNTKIENGLTDFGSFGTISGGTSIVYYNTLTGSSKQSIFAQGDFTSLTGSDYQTFIGYADFLGNQGSTINIRPRSVYINMTDTATTSNATLQLIPAGSNLSYQDTVLNVFTDVQLSEDDAIVRYRDQSNNILSVLQLSEDNAILYHGTGGTQTEIKIVHDNEITANFGGSERFSINANGQVTFNNSFTFPNTDGSPNQVLQTDGSGNVSWAGLSNFGLFSQTGDSATVSATTTETSILGSGVGTLTIPADSFQVGDSFHAKIGGVISAANNEELTIRIKTGASTLATLGPITLTTTTSEFWELEIDFTIRSLGASARLQTNGQFNYVDTGGSGTYLGSGYNTNTTIDTTSSNTLDITVQWGSTNASNSIMSDIFYLKKTY
jgi:hypothetical protein